MLVWRQMQVVMNDNNYFAAAFSFHTAEQKNILNV
jgi:hypothetical protein